MAPTGMRIVVAAACAAMSGCLSPDFEEPTARIRCNDSADCPLGFICHPDTPQCVPADADLEPPWIWRADLSSPRVAPNELLTVAVTASEPLLFIRIAIGVNSSTNTTPVLIDTDPDGYPIYRESVRAPSTSGLHPVRASIRDQEGNPNPEIDVGTLTVDLP